MVVLRIPTAQRAKLRKHLHFVVTPLGSLSGAEAWVTSVLDVWSSTRDRIRVQHSNGSSSTIPRLDARYDWLGWSYDPSGVFGNQSLPVTQRAACEPKHQGEDHSGAVLLVPDSSECDAFAKAQIAASVNASGLVVVAAQGSALYTLNCDTAECSLAAQPNIPVSMITYEDGAAIQAHITAGQSLSMQFSTIVSAGTDFGIDAGGALQQTWGGSGAGPGAVDGNPGDKSAKLYPHMQFILWAAQALCYKARLSQTVGSSTNVLSLFNQTHLRPASGNCYGAAPYGCGPTAVASRAQLDRVLGGRVQLDMALGCAGGVDKECPQWDHIISLRVCCGPQCEAQAAPELARWMSPFGRGEGRWLSDVTLLAPLLGTEGSCNFTIFSAPWAGNQGQIPWLVTLSLRSSAPAAAPEAAAHVLTPWLGTTTETGGIAAVFQWVFFNRSFASNFASFHFDRGVASKVTLAAYITGHGSDQHGCGEFCATQHVFALNGHSFVKNNSLPQTNQALGCTEFVAEGVVPNEYGTWLYGRDGWCNGLPVPLWSVDVSSASSAGGNTLEYHALWNGSLPDPGPQSAWEQAEPVIMLSVYVLLG
eukprot:TRINITY_DN18855_c0_g1_i1.p1 TRINITY_DN18855_c0_g1~~TRINITY_DN18855_c0_g1_i1.p1  ORF type:complete len:590 (+),score=142.77 TRINITY_DN18855_c0_g1_i1:312-2081(+)